MTRDSATQLAAWIESVHPELFAQLYAKAQSQKPAVMRGFGDDTDSSGGFWSSIGDTLSSVGSGIANAAESVGTYLTSSQGLSTLASLGTTYLNLQSSQANSQAQQAVLAQQIIRAQTGVAPAPIAYQNGQPVYNTGAYDGGIASNNLPPALQAAILNGSAQPVQLPDGTIGYELSNPNTLSSVLGSGSIPPWLWIALGGLVLVAIL